MNLKMTVQLKMMLLKTYNKKKGYWKIFKQIFIDIGTYKNLSIAKKEIPKFSKTSSFS